MSHDHEGECIEIVEELYTFIDGYITEERRVTVQRHLDDCLPCFEAFDFEAELRIVVSQRCRDQVPEALRAKIMLILSETSPPAQSADSD